MRFVLARLVVTPATYPALQADNFVGQAAERVVSIAELESERARAEARALNAQLEKVPGTRAWRAATHFYRIKRSLKRSRTSAA